jgi:hypothetical protein
MLIFSRVRFTELDVMLKENEKNIQLIDSNNHDIYFISNTIKEGG